MAFVVGMVVGIVLCDWMLTEARRAVTDAQQLHEEALSFLTKRQARP